MCIYSYISRLHTCMGQKHRMSCSDTSPCSRPDLDSGRGGAEVWTLGPVDRERHRQLTAEVVVRDAGGLAASHPVTVVVDDVNDNPMRPAAKTVYLWKIQVSRGGVEGHQAKGESRMGRGSWQRVSHGGSEGHETKAKSWGGTT